MIGAVLADAHRVLGWRLHALATLMAVASVLEGIGLSMLLPLLSSFGLDGGTDSALTRSIDHVIGAMGVPRDIGPLMVVVVSVLLAQVTATFGCTRFEMACTTRVAAEWQTRLFRAIINGSWPYLQSSSASAQANAIVNDTARVGSAISLSLQMINAAMLIAVYAIISLAAAWQMVVFLLGFGAAVYLATRPISRRSHQIGQQVSDVNSQLMHHTQEFLSGAKLIKATATEATAAGVMDSAVDDLRQINLSAGTLPAAITFVYMACGYVMLGVGVWAALRFATLAPGAIIVSIYVFLRLYVQVSNLQQLRQSFALSAPALPSVRALWEAADAAAEHPGLGDAPRAQGAADVEVDGLRVRYADQVALGGVSLRIASGSMAGITGQSGAGKSTFLDAIAGLLVADAGCVQIDGADLGRLDVRAWRRQIGYVAQDTLLIQGSVAENIAWGAAQRDDAEVERVARLSGAHDFVARMPDGYATRVGGRGVRMSGGQRQRIGLARALYGHKRLLILDEATSALDSESERQVLEAVEGLRGEVTVIVVAHRLSTLRSVDQLHVFEDGKVVESGSFDALRRSSGRFGQLWDMQSGAARAAEANP